MHEIRLGWIRVRTPGAVATATGVFICLSLYSINPGLCLPDCSAHPLTEYTQEPDTTVFAGADAKLYHREGCSLLAGSKVALALSAAVDRGYQPCALCLPLRAAALKWSARVKVTVTATEAVKEAVVNSVTRELQSLGDVLVVDERPAFHLKILALENTSRGSPATDAAIAVLVTKALEDNSAGNQLPACETILNHYLEIGPLDGLQKMAARIIRNFDSSVLAESRRIHQK
jgi:hypothetical protein